MRQICRVLVVALVGVTSFGCSSSPSGPSSAGSTLNVMLKDSPFSDAKSLLVTFSEVSAHVSGAGGFNVLPFAGGGTSRTCDLKKLATAQDILGTGTLAAGHYTQVRLVVTSAALYFDNASTGEACAPTIAAPAGRSAAVNVNSGDVKLNREFDVTSSGATTILVDFNGDQSVKQEGNGSYSMSPVIAVVSVS
jgi:PKD repeat protein